MIKNSAWVDCHAHIDNLSVAEQQAVLSEAREAGVQWIINASDDEASWLRVLELAERFPNVYANLGVHPHHAKDFGEATLEALEVALGRPRVVAVGEIGLDFHYDNSPRDVQVQVFECLLDLALRKNLPVVIHHRESSAETVQCLRRFYQKGLRGMIHCFSGSWSFAKELLDMGMYLSFSGTLTFRTATDIRDVACKVPLDRVMLETDSPYLAPVPVRGTTNQPKYLVHTAHHFAELRKMPAQDLSVQTLQNAVALFGLSLKP